MNPELLKWATLLFKEHNGTFDILRDKMLQVGYKGSDVSGVYDEMIRLGLASPLVLETIVEKQKEITQEIPKPAPAEPIVSPPQTTSQTSVSTSSPITSTQPNNEIISTKENNQIDPLPKVAFSKNIAIIISISVFLVIIIIAIVLYFYGKNNPTSSIGRIMTSTKTMLGLEKPTPAIEQTQNTGSLPVPISPSTIISVATTTNLESTTTIITSTSTLYEATSTQSIATSTATSTKPTATTTIKK